MSKKFNKSSANIHKKKAIDKLENLIDKYIADGSKKAELLSYWLEDYSKYLEFEPKFDPKKLKKYKRGEVIKAHLGYNIGSEEGGLHYCLVLDKNNHISSPVVTVIPLTSMKENKDVNNLRPGEVYLGSDLKDKMANKLKIIESEYDDLKNKPLADLVSSELCDEDQPIKYLEKFIEKIMIIENLKRELNRMKNGSIALVGQITTISKIRIYEPKTNKDALAKIRLSDESLNLIDKEIKSLYIF